jgi:Fic family protein
LTYEVLTNHKRKIPLKDLEKLCQKHFNTIRHAQEAEKSRLINTLELRDKTLASLEESAVEEVLEQERAQTKNTISVLSNIKVAFRERKVHKEGIDQRVKRLQCCE